MAQDRLEECLQAVWLCPSASDVEVTNQLKAAGSVVGITLLEHIIFNRTGYFSFLEAGRL